MNNIFLEEIIQPYLDTSSLHFLHVHLFKLIYQLQYVSAINLYI